MRATLCQVLGTPLGPRFLRLLATGIGMKSAAVANDNLIC